MLCGVDASLCRERVVQLFDLEGSQGISRTELRRARSSSPPSCTCSSRQAHRVHISMRFQMSAQVHAAPAHSMSRREGKSENELSSLAVK